jgi:hypothetical protein
MLNEISRKRVVGLWFAAVAAIIASLVAMGVTASVSTTALVLTLSLLPPAVMFVLWRAPPPTIAEILRTANTPKEGPYGGAK